MKQADQLSGTELIQQVEQVGSRTDLPELLDQAAGEMEARKFGDAVLTWNKVLEVDPDHPAALRGIELAGRGFRDEQHRLEDLRKAEMIFQEGDYYSALKILYRLPDDIRPEQVLQFKVSGWFNLGLIALKAGRIDQCLGHFNEIQAIAPDDETAMELREFALGYQSQELDRAFYQRVNDLEFRAFNDRR